MTSKPEKSGRVFGYARISSEGQIENTSMTVQEERIQAWVRSRGEEISSIVSDVMSGSTLIRPGLNRLREMLREGDSVVVYRLDRLSRSIVDAEPLISEWEKAGISLHSVTEPLDTKSPMGRAMFRMAFVFAQAEREIIAERMASGKTKNAQDGKFNGSPIVYGFRRGRDGERDFEVVPEEADIIQKLFKWYSTGRLGVTRLRRMTGCPLSESGIRELLKNVFVTGRISYQGKIRDNNHPAIVSQRLFNRCQKVSQLRQCKKSLESHNVPQ